MNNKTLLGSTVYWNMAIADYCRFHAVWQELQPYVRTTLRPSRQEGKIVVVFNINDVYSAGLYLQARLDLPIPSEEGTDIIIKYNTNQ